MKKYFTLLMACAAVLAACTKEDDRFGMPSSDPVTISAYIPGDGLTKVSLTQDTANPDGAVKLYWEAGDVITVKNAVDETKSVEFVYKSGAGTTAAQFTAPGGVAALAGATSYNIYLTSHLPGGFASQTQACDGSTAHLGYAATLSGVNAYDGATFSEDWASANGDGTFDSSSVLRLRAQLPTAAMADAVQKVIVKASKPIFDEDNELSIAITTPGVEGDSKVVTVYATLPAGDVCLAAGTELLFQFQVSDDVHDKYTAWRKLDAATTLTGGQVNAFKINCPDIASFAGPADDGTEAHPYLIGDRHQMDKMRNLLVNSERKYFKMVDDVDLSGIANWVPVSQNADAQADFNGAGHTIFHLTIDATSASYTYVGFFGLLYGNVHHVIFDGANVNGGIKLSAIVMGRTGASSYAANFSEVTVRNSTLTASNNYVGGICGYVKKSNGFSKCRVIDCSISNTITESANLVGGLVGWMGPNGGCTLTDCFAERVTVNGGVTNTNQSGIGGLIGRIEGSSVVITRCHTTGIVSETNTNNVGGLVGDIAQGTNIIIENSYSTCAIKGGYTFAGGLVGRIKEGAGVTIDHCFASGNLSLLNGYGGKGGLVGVILGTGATVKKSIAWNGLIKARNNQWSSGAVVGCAHPNCVLTDNYRNPAMSISGAPFWVPSTSFDHANVNGTTTPLKRIDSSKDESNLVTGTAEDFANTDLQKYFAYQGKHLDSNVEVTPDNTFGFISSSSISGIDFEPDPDPENPSYTGDNVWGLGTTETIVDGVQWTNYHGTWEGKIREINIITTTLNEHNKLKLYYNYTEDGKKYLDEKCNYVTNAVAATNGPMTSQFVRVDNVVKKSAQEMSEWTNNCAFTIDGDEVDIVKVASNFEAATLGNNSVICAGPLLVWKGNKLTASAEWLAADTNRWLTDGKNTGGQPRTAIGINKEGNKLIQVTVDGRWTSGSDDKKAYGMATDLLAELMLQLGCYKAMNLDGGGGSQMWIYGKGDKHNIVNHPHNTWPTYENGSGYYWSHNNEVGRRTTCCAVYIESDLK